MPCWSINTVSIEFKAANFSLVERAATVLGWKALATNNTVTIATAAGVIRIANGLATGDRSTTQQINSLRMQYSKEVLKEAKLRMGGLMVQKTPTKFVVKRG